MNSNTSNNLLEYLSLVLVLSFFWLHNIFIVIISIFYSLYSINKEYINKYYKLYKNKILYKKSIKIDNSILLENDKKELKENNIKFSLVETIEELGIIPSLDNNNENNAA